MMTETSFLRKVEVLLEDHQHYHSDFQLDNFITTRAGSYHIWGMYQQALRELSVRVATIKADSLRVREIELEIALLRIASSGLAFRRKRRIERERAGLDIEKLETERESITGRLPDREREFKRFFGHAYMLKSKVGDITEERRTELDEDLWTHRIKLRLAIEIFRDGEPSINTLEILPCLPKPIADKVWAALKDPKLGEWFSQLRAPSIPALDVVIDPSTDVLKVLEAV